MQEQAIGIKELDDDQSNEEVEEHYLAHAKGAVTSFFKSKNFVIIRHVRRKLCRKL